MFSHQTNATATARNVLAGLKSGSPITDSARESMPRLVELMRSFGETELADDIAAAMAER